MEKCNIYKYIFLTLYVRLILKILNTMLTCGVLKSGAVLQKGLQIVVWGQLKTWLMQQSSISSRLINQH